MKKNEKFISIQVVFKLLSLKQENIIFLIFCSKIRCLSITYSLVVCEIMIDENFFHYQIKNINFKKGTFKI